MSLKRLREINSNNKESYDSDQSDSDYEIKAKHSKHDDAVSQKNKL